MQSTLCSEGHFQSMVGRGESGGGLGGGGEGDGGGGESEGGSGLDKGLDRKVLTCSTAWSGVYWTEYDGDAVVKSTGSHCGGQATPRFAAEGRDFELRWPIAGGSPRISPYSLVSQALGTVESARRTFVSVLATLGLLLLIINDRNLSRVARVAMPKGSRVRDATVIHVRQARGLIERCFREQPRVI